MSFFLALIFGLGLTPLARRVGIAAGLVDRPSEPIKIHDRPMPVLGGLAILLAAFAAVAIALGSVPPGLALGVAFALGVGLLDDVKSLPIGPRAVMQVAAGVIAATSLVGGTWPWAAVGAGVLTLACANAVNMLDGQDGLAGVVSAVSAASLAIVAMVLGTGDDVAPVLAAVSGGCLAFLGWNRPPASIFLGDGGAYGLGVVFGWVSVAITIDAGWRGLLAAGCCLLVPAYELTSTILRRLLGSGSLTAGDRAHS
jgi:UDP-GlcNAc:undecaprenyl-phosphate/decaprenyl-phosphate GlcNAc-1-phosphate transferase